MKTAELVKHVCRLMVDANVLASLVSDVSSMPDYIVNAAEDLSANTISLYEDVLRKASKEAKAKGRGRAAK